MLLIIDKILIVVSATTGGKFIISFVIFIGTPAGIANARFYSCIFFDYRNSKKSFEYNKK